MVEIINKSETYADKMRQEGKVVTFNKLEDIQVNIIMNESLEQFRREYQVKDRNSQMSAAKVILTR